MQLTLRANQEKYGLTEEVGKFMREFGINVEDVGELAWYMGMMMFIYTNILYGYIIHLIYTRAPCKSRNNHTYNSNSRSQHPAQQLATISACNPTNRWMTPQTCTREPGINSYSKFIPSWPCSYCLPLQLCSSPFSSPKLPIGCYRILGCRCWLCLQLLDVWLC